MEAIGFLLKAAMGLGALAAVAHPGGAAAADPSLRRALDAVAQRRVFFGHQSVGANILDGLRQLARAEGVAVHIVEVDSAVHLPPGTFAHALVPHNSRPDLKLENFARALGSGGSPGPDVAFVKLCFVDFTPDTDAAALFASYRRTLAALAERHPGTVFVHVTVPLTTVPGGPKAFVKRLLGRPQYSVAGNARRDEYNTLLRGAYGGREPVFDIAAIESTRPDGSRETLDWNGRRVPALVPAYTDDGGHLNEAARLRVARELVALLASLPAREGRAGAGPSSVTE